MHGFENIHFKLKDISCHGLSVFPQKYVQTEIAACFINCIACKLYLFLMPVTVIAMHWSLMHRERMVNDNWSLMTLDTEMYSDCDHYSDTNTLQYTQAEGSLLMKLDNQ